MTPWVDVDGGRKGFDVNCLLYPSFDPVLLAVENGDILFAEVMVVFPSMLKHGRFKFAKSICSSGSVLLESCIGGPFSLADIRAWAWCGIGASTRYVVDEADGLFLGELVFWLDKCLPEGTTGLDG